MEVGHCQYLSIHALFFSARIMLDGLVLIRYDFFFSICHQNNSLDVFSFETISFRARNDSVELFDDMSVDGQWLYLFH